MTSRHDGTKNGRRALWSALILIGLTIVFGACAAANRGAVEKFISQLFGPPTVKLREAYKDKPDSPSFDHSALDTLLKKHVDANGWVDYAGIKADVRTLDEYLTAVETAPLDKLGRSERLVFLLNAYNAFTIKLIVEHYPIDSIQDIPNAWDLVRWEAGGHTWSLNQIEHEQIRPAFVEPRIHFALVCAAVGCPPLRSEAFATERLEEQLEAQTAFVHNHASWFKFKRRKNRVGLTKLYQWYGGDFVQVSGSVLKYAGDFNADLKAQLDKGREPGIDWLSYDWSLNDKSNAAPR